MKSITLLNRTVNIDVDKLSQGIADMHKANPEHEAALKMGLLNAQLIELFEKQFEPSVRKQYSELVQMVCEEELKSFIKTTKQEIIKGVYRFVEMDV